MMDKYRDRITTNQEALPNAPLLPVGVRDEFAGCDNNLTDRLLPGSRSVPGVVYYRGGCSLPIGNTYPYFQEGRQISSQRVLP